MKSLLSSKKGNRYMSYYILTIPKLMNSFNSLSVPIVKLFKERAEAIGLCSFIMFQLLLQFDVLLAI